MSGILQIGLRGGEKLYINGAVLSVDRKVRIELLNDATFLLGSHVMQLKDATTPLRQIYFLIQGLLMDPGVRGVLVPALEKSIEAAATLHAAMGTGEELGKALRFIQKGSPFDALKVVRGLISVEEGAMPIGNSNAQPRKEVA